MALITINEYNAMQSRIASILGTTDAGYGLAQLSSSQLIAPTPPAKLLIRAAEINNLRADLLKAIQHQTGEDYTTRILAAVIPKSGDLASDYNRVSTVLFDTYNTMLTKIETGKWDLPRDDTTGQSTTSTLSPDTRNAIWNDSIFHVSSAQFTSEQTAKYFFNAGGRLIANVSMVGATPTNDKSGAWATMLNAIGTITIDHATTKVGSGPNPTVYNTGFYSLTGVYADIFTRQCAAPYTANTYTLSAMKTSGNVYLKMLLNDAYTGSPDLVIYGTISCSVQARGATGNNISVLQPTVTTSASLAASSNVTPGYSVELNPPNITEGFDLTIKITAYQGLSTVWYKIVGDGPGIQLEDFTDNVIIASIAINPTGDTSFTKTVAHDIITDGCKIKVELYDSDPANPSATKLKTSNEVILTDSAFSLNLALVSPNTPVVSENQPNNTARFSATGTSLPATPVTATWTATVTGGATLQKTTDIFLIAGNAPSEFDVVVDPNYKTDSTPSTISVKVAIGTVESTPVVLTVTDTSKPTVTYISTKETVTGPTGTAFTHTTMTYTITGGKPNGTYNFTRAGVSSASLPLNGSGDTAAITFDGLLTPGDLVTEVTFIDTGEVITHTTTFSNDTQALSISNPLDILDITYTRSLQIDVALSKCYDATPILWELLSSPTGISDGATPPEQSGEIETTGNNGTGIGSLTLASAVDSIKGSSFKVKFSLKSDPTISITTADIRIIDAFPYTTNLDAQIFLPTLASAVTIKARGGAGGGGGRDGSNGDGGDGGPATTIITKEPVGSVRKLSAVIGKGGNPGTSNATSAGGGLGGTGYKKGGDGGAVRNDNTSGGGAGGGGATAVSADTTVLVVAGGGGGGGGGSSARDGIDATGTNTTVTVLTGTDGIAGDGGGSGDGGGAGGSGGFVTTIGTNLKGADSSRSSTAGTSGNIAYDNSQPAVTGTPFLINTNTGGLGATTKTTGTTGVDGEVTIYVQPMAPQYPVAYMQPGGSEVYWINADSPLKDGSLSVTDYTITASAAPISGLSTLTTLSLPVSGGTFTFTTGQLPSFNIAANNDFGKGEEITVPVQTAKITTTNLGVNFGFSCAISADGNYLVVGSLKENTKGSATIYKRTGNVWSFDAVLVGNATSAGDQFGYSVDITDNGDRVIVGSPTRAQTVSGTAYPSTGAAHIFKRNSSTGQWTEEVFLESGNSDQDLTPLDKPNDYFGASVKISGDGTMVLVGAYGDDSGTTYSIGFIWPYYINSTTNSWAGVSGTTGSTGYLPTGANEAFAYHGWSLALSGNSLICAEGAPGDNNKGWYNSSAADLGSAGTVCLFKRTSASAKTWSVLKSYIYSPTPIADGAFGTSVAMNEIGTIVVVGAPGESAFGLSKAGAVHIYNGSNTTWDIQATLYASDAEVNASFGTSVAINDDGDTILIGAIKASTGSRSAAGKVYKFVKSGTVWVESMIITPYDKKANDWFGKSVSMSSTGELAVVGAPSTVSTEPGAAYTYRLGSLVADDQHWDKVSLLITAENGVGNSFVDLSNNSLPLTPSNANVVVSTTNKKFGTGSISFPSAAKISTPVSSALDFTNSQFTMEAWIYPTAVGVPHGCIFINPHAVSGKGWELQIEDITKKLSFQYNFAVSGSVLYGPVIAINAWSHVAVTYDGSTLRLYSNGVLGANITTAVRMSTGSIDIGYHADTGSGSADYRGYIDEIRITNGVARYTGTTHTVPTATFTPTFTFKP